MSKLKRPILMRLENTQRTSIFLKKTTMSLLITTLQPPKLLRWRIPHLCLSLSPKKRFDKDQNLSNYKKKILRRTKLQKQMSSNNSILEWLKMEEKIPTFNICCLNMKLLLRRVFKIISLKLNKNRYWRS